MAWRAPMHTSPIPPEEMERENLRVNLRVAERELTRAEGRLARLVRHPAKQQQMEASR